MKLGKKMNKNNKDFENKLEDTINDKKSETKEKPLNKDYSNRSYTELFSSLENLPHGEKFTKFVATDGPSIYGDGDLSVEIHGLIDESGTIYIVSEKITRYKNEEA